MLAKRFVLIIALLTLVVSPVVFASGAAAQSDASAAAELCRQLDERGAFDDPEQQITFGECVNFLKGALSPQDTNFIAAFCGQTRMQRVTETTNKGQCIKVLKALP
jgi:hypothetical protein